MVEPEVELVEAAGSKERVELVEVPRGG